MPNLATAPTVSIVMPCHNAAPHLPTSIGSVISQTFTDWELITVDDGSSDDTLKWLQDQTDPRLRIVSQVNKGVSSARNAGIKYARGQFIAFLDADDTWAPSFLEKLLAKLAAQPHAAMAYCGWRNVGLPGPLGRPFIPPDYESSSKREMLFAGCRWPIHAAVARRSAVNAAGGFNTSLENAEDYALWLELGGLKPIARVPEVLAFYHFHGGPQASSNRARAATHLLQAQRLYLDRYPKFAAQLGRTRIRELIYGNLLRTGFDCYWKRDLAAARSIFREVMGAGYGSPRDWIYLLPALLPIRLHEILLNTFSSDAGTRPKDSGEPH